MGLEAKTLEERASWLIQASDWLAMIPPEVQVMAEQTSAGPPSASRE
jgi:hypothetical protein